MTFDHESFMRENMRRQMLFQAQQDALKRAKEDPVDGLLGGLFGIGLPVAGIVWALEWFWQKIGFAVVAALGRRAIARNIGQHRLRTAFWLFLPLIVWAGLLIAYIVKHDLTVYGDLLPTILWEDVIKNSLTFAQHAPLWCRLCWAWSLISILWFTGGLLGLAFIRLLPHLAAAMRLNRWLFGAVVIVATWTLATWIKNTL